MSLEISPKSLEVRFKERINMQETREEAEQRRLEKFDKDVATVLAMPKPGDFLTFGKNCQGVISEIIPFDLIGRQRHLCEFIGLLKLRNTLADDWGYCWIPLSPNPKKLVKRVRKGLLIKSTKLSPDKRAFLKYRITTYRDDIKTCEYDDEAAVKEFLLDYIPRQYGNFFREINATWAEHKDQAGTFFATTSTVILDTTMKRFEYQFTPEELKSMGFTKLIIPHSGYDRQMRIKLQDEELAEISEHTAAAIKSNLKHATDQRDFSTKLQRALNYAATAELFALQSSKVLEEYLE
jgi:hypothetical protein